MAQAIINDAEIIEALRAVREHGSQRKAALALELNRTTVDRYVELGKQRGLTADSIVRDPLLKAQSEAKALRAALKRAQQSQDGAARVREEIYELAARTPAPPKWLVKQGTLGHRGTPFLLCSDWHFGEIVRGPEVNNVNVFNTEIAKIRAEKLFKTAVSLAFDHMGRAPVKYPGIICALAGDMTTGAIHPESIETDRAVLQTLNDLEDVLIPGLALLADKFGKVYVPCVCGNHGRNTLKPRMSGYVHWNYEWNLYCSLEKHFKRIGDTRIQFDIPEQTDLLFKSYGHRYMLTHGDNLGTAGGDGMIGVLGPIMRGAIKVGRSESQIGRDFDTLVIGHYHQKLVGPGNCVIVNNSLKGYDTYAKLKLRAAYSRPSQALWFTHPEHGITAHWDIYLDKLRAANENKKWVEFQR